MNILSEKLHTADRSGPPACGLGEGLTNAHRKNSFYEMSQTVSDLDGYFRTT